MIYPYFGYGLGILAFIVVMKAIVIVLIVIAAFWLVRRFVFGHGHHMHHWHNHWMARSGLEILNERYAKGEITKEEFEERRTTLLGK